MSVGVYRAPMRSRRDDVAPGRTLSRARAIGVCGFGGVLQPAPLDVEEAVTRAAAQHDARLAARIARFADVEAGSFAWTRDGDGLFWLGRLSGPWRYDSDAEAAAVDLVHVRACRWCERPVLLDEAPSAVLATFGRGGRNFQQIHHPAVLGQTRQIWESRG
jgi:hypothetical protein